MNVQNYSIATTFGINLDPSVTVEGRADVGNPFVPEKDDGFFFNQDNLSDVLAWIKMGCKEPLFLTGPTGSGKTSLIKQVAARLHIPVQEITGHGRLEVPDMIGRVGILGGDTMFLDGPLTAAYREGAWFLLNEQDLLDPSTNAGLNGILERAPLTLLENSGEVVKPNLGFAFIATANTAGGGDLNGSYLGTNHQNAAFMDRFLMMCVDYPSAEAELALLQKRFVHLQPRILESMIKVANEVRNLYKGQESNVAGASGVSFEITFSTRTLIRWGGLMEFFQKKPGINLPQYTLDRALGLRAEPTTRVALHSIVQHIMGD